MWNMNDPLFKWILLGGFILLIIIALYEIWAHRRLEKKAQKEAESNRTDIGD